MTSTHRFILNCLALSLPLVVLGRHIERAYLYIMGVGIQRLNPGYPMIVVRAEDAVSGSSMTLVAFIAVMMAVPGVAATRRLAALAVGLVALLVVDWSFVQYAIVHRMGTVLDERAPVYELYLCAKCLLPFAAWLVASSALSSTTAPSVSAGDSPQQS